MFQLHLLCCLFGSQRTQDHLQRLYFVCVDQLPKTLQFLRDHQMLLNHKTSSFLLADILYRSISAKIERTSADLIMADFSFICNLTGLDVKHSTMPAAGSFRK